MSLTRKVHMLKHCRVDGKPAKPGDVVETSHHRAKALTDNSYAKPHNAEAEKPADVEELELSPAQDPPADPCPTE